MNATQVFGANAMTSEERRRRQFDGVADVDAAARVWTAASELRERLAALSEAAELPAKPATSAGFYGEDELQGILAMHEQVLDVVAQHCSKGLGLDIGANVGATLNNVRRCAGGEECTGVIAFEPNPANLPLLREAATDDVTIVERAASDVADVTVAFNLPTGTDQVRYPCCLSR